MLPYGRQCIEEDDIAAVTEALRSDYLTTGPRVAAFEKGLCEATGAGHTVVCSNGTTALHLAALTVGLGPGDTAIVPSITFLATANAVRYTGAEVIFADVDPQTGLMEVAQAEAALARATVRPKAIFPVDLAGQSADLPALKKLADRHDMKVIVDACHSLGAQAYGQRSGDCAYADLAVFSFHPVKAIACGEGGAITTNNAEYAERMRVMRSHGMKPAPDVGPWAYDMTEPGYNYRLTDIQCALGLSQLKKLDRFIARRRELAALYGAALAGLAPVVRPPARAPSCESAWHLYAARIDFRAAGFSRADFMTALKEQGVGTQVHYIPVHSQPYYKKRYGAINLPGAAHYYEHTLSLPLFPAMRDEDVGFVVQALRAVLGRDVKKAAGG